MHGRLTLRLGEDCAHARRIVVIGSGTSTSQYGSTREHMKILFFALILVIVGCAPSAEAVQAAIAQTQAAATQTQASLPTATPPPLPTSAPEPTSTIEPTHTPVAENSVESIATYTAKEEARWNLKDNDGGVGTVVEIKGCLFAVRSVVADVQPNKIDLLTDLQEDDWWPDPKENYIYGVDILVANKTGACEAKLILKTIMARLFGSDGHNYDPKLGLLRDEDFSGMTFKGKVAEEHTGMIYFEVPAGVMPVALQWDWLTLYPRVKVQIELAK